MICADFEALRRGVAGCRWVFHVAALYSYWGHSWDEFFQANVEGTRRVLEAALDAGATRIVHTSSIATLGLPTDGSPGTEDTPSLLANMIGPYNAPSSWPRTSRASTSAGARRWS